MTTEGEPGEVSREGWHPVAGRDASLEEIVEVAFDYRGDVTVMRAGEAPLAGYLYNRDREAAVPFVQVLDHAGASHTVPYADVVTIHFTGKDTAAGTSYEAWLRRKAEAAAGPGA